MTNSAQPSPDLFFDTLTAHQKTAALKAAIDLNLFTALAVAPATAAQIAKACNAAELQESEDGQIIAENPHRTG